MGSWVSAYGGGGGSTSSGGSGGGQLSAGANGNAATIAAGKPLSHPSLSSGGAFYEGCGYNTGDVSGPEDAYF